MQRKKLQPCDSILGISKNISHFSLGFTEQRTGSDEKLYIARYVRFFSLLPLLELLQYDILRLHETEAN